MIHNCNSDDSDNHDDDDVDYDFDIIVNDDNDVNNVIETILLLIDENNMNKIELFHVLIETFSTFFTEEEIEIYMNYAYTIYSIIFEKDDDDIITLQKKIDFLRQQIQPPQRTLEWYEFRHNMITASNVYKALGSQCSINNLIVEKCQPMQTNISTNEQMINTNSPMHWGQKYEPISVEIYEHKYQTKVELFGCIRHSQYSFLGASPDGINVDITSPLYGRMLEIKNVVSRQITGIPKNEYFIQMQLQMEVCNLNSCDFLETKFMEYENKWDYENDGCSDILLKGYFIFFMDSTTLTPYYIYKPIDLIDPLLIKEWDKKVFDTYTSSPYNWKWAKRCYWKLITLSCVLVQRDQKWFQQNIMKINECWNIIEKERINGEYISRLPIKKMKIEKKQELSSGLLLSIE